VRASRAKAVECAAAVGARPVAKEKTCDGIAARNRCQFVDMDHTITSPSAVITAIRAIVPAGIALAGGAIGLATSSPFAEENEFIQRAVEKRRREFVAGRQYARAAMSQLGLRPVPITVLPSRAPAWPEGLTGSISHSGDVCVALVAAQSDFIGFGVDIELSTSLPTELYPTVCRHNEMFPAQYCIDPAKMLFVVKEAFFKLYHPITGYFIDFLDVSVHLEPFGGTFNLELHAGPPALQGQRSFEGVCGYLGDYCFAFLSLRSC
jgi:4'-phosphopantetheinyl transferase EntD